MILRYTIFIFFFISQGAMAQIDIVPDDQLKFQSTFLEGKKYQLIGRQDKAEEIFKNLYEQDKTNAVVTFELAQLYYKKQDLDESLKHASLAAAREPNNFHYQNFYGVISLESNKYGDAITIFKKLYDTDPRNEEYADKLSTAYMLSGDYDNSIAVYNELESNIGIKEEIVKRKIDVFQLANNNEAIESELNKLVQLYPSNKSYLHNLAAFYTDQKKTNEAKSIYEKIIQLDENDAVANLALVSNPDQSINDDNYLRSLLPIIKDDKIAIDNKVLELIPFVEELAASIDPELGGALESVTETLKNVHPEEAKAYAIYGDVLQLNEKPHEAIKMYQKTLELDDSNYVVWEQLMYAMVNEKAFMDLEEISEEALDYYPNEPTAYLMHGIALKENDQIKKSISILDEGVLVASGDDNMKSKLLTALAEAYRSHEDYKQAMKAIQQAVEISNGKNLKAVQLQENINQEAFMRGIK